MNPIATFVEPTDRQNARGGYASYCEAVAFDETGAEVSQEAASDAVPAGYRAFLGQYLPRRLSDLPIAVVNLAQRDTNYQVSNTALSELQKDTQRLLETGGVLVTIMRYYEPKEEEGWVLRLDPVMPKHDNYTWLPFDLYSRLDIPAIAGAPGTNFRTIARDDDLLAYMQEVERYFLAADPRGLEELPDVRSVGVLAKGEASKDAIAWEFRISNGLAIFLPPSPGNDWRWRVLRYAQRRLEEIRTQDAGAAAEEPPWLEEWPLNEEVHIEHKASKLREQLEELRRQRKRYATLNQLLYATGDPLETGVARLFEELECTVEVQERGANTDYHIEGHGYKLVLETTGLQGPVAKKSVKVAQLATAFQESNEGEKIVLAANPHLSESDLVERQKKESFTQDFQHAVSGFDPCLITTVQLFELWRQHIEDSRPADDIIQSIADTNGVYQGATLVPRSQRSNANTKSEGN